MGSRLEASNREMKRSRNERLLYGPGAGEQFGTDKKRWSLPYQSNISKYFEDIAPYFQSVLLVHGAGIKDSPKA